MGLRPLSSLSGNITPSLSRESRSLPFYKNMTWANEAKVCANIVVTKEEI